MKRIILTARILVRAAIRKKFKRFSIASATENMCRFCAGREIRIITGLALM